MVYSFSPKGVCSVQMNVEVEGDTIKSAEIIGGCPGNTLGLAKLVEGMKVDEAIKRLKGIQCRSKGTSCPDQFARGLEEMKEKSKK